MAEASGRSAETSNFFCHKCNQEIAPKIPEYACPICNNGFIECMEGIEDSDSDSSNEPEWSFLTVPEPIRPSDLPAEDNNGPRRSSRLRRTQPPRTQRVGLLTEPNHFMPFLQEILGPVQGEMGIFPDRFQFSSIPLLVAPNLASNPADYAWGRGGLDTIMTHLLNQFDGPGPAPLPEDKIKQIPTVNITQDQCDKNLQCSVCMDDFVLNDSVRKLLCGHCYHEQCILPWLKLHGTCPVCRKELNKDIPSTRTSSQSPSSSINSLEMTLTTSDPQQVIIRTTPNGQFVSSPQMYTEEELD